MKKRAPAKKQTAARKPAAKKKAPSKRAVKATPKATPATRSATSPGPTRDQASGQTLKYTPAPLKSDGSPAFRYPPQ
jgi:hypothetical protein